MPFFFFNTCCVTTVVDEGVLSAFPSESGTVPPATLKALGNLLVESIVLGLSAYFGDEVVNLAGEELVPFEDHGVYVWGADNCFRPFV
jgi:hypothetical protein